MGRLLFGTAGVPISSPGGSSTAGIGRIRELGLDCMELEFVRGVRMSEDTAIKVKEKAKDAAISLSVHAPYYINLNSKEPEKCANSRMRILKSARIGALCGAKSVVFHSGYYEKDDRSVVYEKIKSQLVEIVHELKNSGLSIILRPETTGRDSQFGTLDEILSLSKEIDGVMPCIDFSHLHAKEGKLNSYEEFIKVLATVREVLGKRGLENMHMHVSGIEYTSKGERRHLILEHSDFKYQELLRALIDMDVSGSIICESPNLEEDAMLLKREYENYVCPG